MFILATELPLGLDFKEILLHLLNFFILLTALYFLLYKPVRSFMVKREEEYKQAEQKAQEGLKQAEATKEEQEALLKSARQTAVKITQEAEASASMLQKELLEEAKEQAKGIIDKAQNEINEKKEKAKEELIHAAGDLALEIAGKILEREVSSKDNDALIENVIEQWSK